LLGALAYVVAIAVALASPLASFTLDGVVVVYFALSSSDVPGLIVTSSTHE
jgi:hypothetical protein